MPHSTVKVLSRPQGVDLRVVLQLYQNTESQDVACTCECSIWRRLTGIEQNIKNYKWQHLITVTLRIRSVTSVCASGKLLQFGFTTVTVCMQGVPVIRHNITATSDTKSRSFFVIPPSSAGAVYQLRCQ